MGLKTVRVPAGMEPLFRRAEEVVGRFFDRRNDNPSAGTIEIFDSRYVLLRGASLSVEFFLLVRNLFGEGQGEAADSFTASLLYDLAHAVGRTDAQNFHARMGLEDPMARLSAGPVHFAHAGWAFVDIHPDSRPAPDDTCYLLYDHTYSFEADAWLAAGERPLCATCVMSAGYSSGWCEESFGLHLEAREIACRTLGDAHCRFIMAPPARVAGHIERYFAAHPDQKPAPSYFHTPDFFARKEVLEAFGRGDTDARMRTAAEKQLMAYARRLEATQALLNEKLWELEREVEERKRAEALYRNLVEQINDVVFAIDREGRFTYISPVIERISPFTVSDILGQPFQSFVHPDDLDGLIHSYGRTLAGHQEPFEFRIGRTGGEVRCVRTSSRAIVEDGVVVGVRGVMTDVTERKKAEAEREKLIAELEAKNRELERFTYTVSHDLKSPLVTIKGFLGLLRRDVAAAGRERMEEDMARIDEAADKMGRLLDELLELSRIGRMVNPPAPVKPAEVAREALALVEGQREARSVAVTIDAAMPVVRGDRMRLVQVYQNLLDNAVKFMGDQPEPRIEVGCRRDGDEPVFFVHDNGMGIDPAYHEKVFGLFERLEAGRGGTGIGLALVRRIVEIHGGRVWIESDGQGQGAAFCFTLPAGEGVGG